MSSIERLVKSNLSLLQAMGKKLFGPYVVFAAVPEVATGKKGKKHHDAIITLTDWCSVLLNRPLLECHTGPAVCLCWIGFPRHWFPF